MVECEACCEEIPFEDVVWEYADKGTWWEQSWAYCSECAAAKKSSTFLNSNRH